MLSGMTNTTKGVFPECLLRKENHIFDEPDATFIQAERLINWLFRDDFHCAKAYVSELHGVQNAPEYRK